MSRTQPETERTLSLPESIATLGHTTDGDPVNYLESLKTPDHTLNRSGHTTGVFEARDSTRWMCKQLASNIFAVTEVGISRLYASILPGSIPAMQIYRHTTQIQETEVTSDIEGDDEHDGFSSINQTSKQFHKTVGTASKLFDIFIDLEAYLAKTISPATEKKYIDQGLPNDFVQALKTQTDIQKRDWLIDHGFIEVTAASAVFQEDDLHKRNIGITYNKKTKEFHVVRIDFDMSMQPFLERHGRARTNLDRKAANETTHKLSAEDIAKFPTLSKDSYFYYWPTEFRNCATSQGYTSEENELFSGLAYDPKIQPKAYETFLKAVLLPNDFIRAVFSDNRASDYLIKHLKSLQKTLFDSPEFITWFEKITPACFAKILASFAQYNTTYPAGENSSYHIISALVSDKYFQLILKQSLKNATVAILPFQAIILQFQEGSDDAQKLLTLKSKYINALISAEKPTNNITKTLNDFANTLQDILDNLSEFYRKISVSKIHFNSFSDMITHIIFRLKQQTTTSKKVMIHHGMSLEISMKQISLSKAYEYCLNMSSMRIKTLFDVAYTTYRNNSPEASSWQFWSSSTIEPKAAYEATLTRLNENTGIDEKAKILHALFSLNVNPKGDSPTKEFLKALMLEFFNDYASGSLKDKLLSDPILCALTTQTSESLAFLISDNLVLDFMTYWTKPREVSISEFDDDPWQRIAGP